MEPGKKESKIYLKVSIGMTVCVVIAILITSSILYFNFQSILMKHEYETNLEKMESEGAKRQQLSNIALNILFQITNDISVTKLLNASHIDAIDESTAFIQLRHFLVTIPNVDSIYVYNMKKDVIYNVSNESDLIKPWNVDYYTTANFYDASAVEMIKNCTDYTPFIAAPRYYKVNDTDTKCVYTYMMYDIFNKSNQSNVIMLNLEADYLFHEDKLKEPDTVSLVVDKKNTIIYSNSEQFKILDYLDSSFDRDGVMENEASGYFLAQINGVKSVVIFTETDKYGWKYVSILEYDKMLSQVMKLQSTIIFISVMIFVIGVLAAVAYSRRVSNPIRDMTQDIKNLRSERKLAENITKRIKLKELLENGGLESGGGRKTGAELLSLLGIHHTEGKKMILVCICMDEYQHLLETINAQTVSAYKFAAVNILNELMGNVPTYSLDIGIDKNLLFFHLPAECTEEQLDDYIGQMQQLVKDYFSVGVSAAVSDFTETPNDIYFLYEQLEEILSRSIFWGNGAILHYTDMKIKDVHLYEYPENKEKQLTEFLTYGKAREAEEVYQTIISETYNYPIVIYNMAISRLVFVINNVVNLVTKNNSSHSLASSIILSGLLQENDTIEVRNRKFHELFIQIQQELENKKSDRIDQVIAGINNRIEANYANPSLSIEMLADEIGISAAYMCRIYKQHTGSTINETLLNKRMEKARELLTESNASINTIAEKVGFTGSSYFYRAFKKVNGVTPNEYRRA